jgi:hypothetical protein
MLRFPLLRSKLEKPATLLLFGSLLAFSAPHMNALAAGEDQAQPPVISSGASVDAKPAAGEAAGQNKAAPEEAKPREVKPEAAANAQSAPAQDSSAGAETPGKADAKPAAAAEPKSAGANDAGKPKDIVPKPADTQAVGIRPSTVNAVYNISFMGAQIGEFKIRSAITPRQYSLQANAELSALFGLVSWKGVTSSFGLMTANGPAPQNYTFRYATSDKREAVELRFQQRTVQDIIINPPVRYGARAVPITAEDLQNVVDPLSAIVLLTQARPSRLTGAEACNKRLPIFDGKIRYDLVLSPKGTRKIDEEVGKLRGTAFVCRVNFVPIAGHKAGKGDYASGNSGIEIWLVPMPQAGLLVPYYVHVPTPAGTASMISARFDVETSVGRHALAD